MRSTVVRNSIYRNQCAQERIILLFPARSFRSFWFFCDSNQCEKSIDLTFLCSRKLKFPNDNSLEPSKSSQRMRAREKLSRSSATASPRTCSLWLWPRHRSSIFIVWNSNCRPFYQKMCIVFLSHRSLLILLYNLFLSIYICCHLTVL